MDSRSSRGELIVEYRQLGDTDLQVSAYGLGTWMFGREGNRDPGECAAMIHTALDAGITLIDTADAYSSGDAESAVGAAIRGRRRQVILASKVGYPAAGRPGSGGLTRQWILSSIEDSLKRLQTDYLDVYLLHRPDPSTRLEESLATLDELVRAGKVRVAGCSTFPAWQVVESWCISARSGSSPLGCEQPPYSILVRAAERDVFPVARRYGMGTMVWSPLAGGWLTGKYRGGAAPIGSRAARALEFDTENPRIGERYDVTAATNGAKVLAVDRLAHLAEESRVPLAGLALAFTQAHPAVSSALIGPRTLPQLVDLLSLMETRLDASILDRIDEIVPPGAVLNDADRGWDPPWMSRMMRRRGSSE
jgi:aryl-alcohol dehydrogenase-like predicted oxidoreductase